MRVHKKLLFQTLAVLPWFLTAPQLEAQSICDVHASSESEIEFKKGSVPSSFNESNRRKILFEDNLSVYERSGAFPILDFEAVQAEGRDLFIPLPFQTMIRTGVMETLEFYEAASLFVIPLDPRNLRKNDLHNLEFLEAAEPKSDHEVLEGELFKVKSSAPLDFVAEEALASIPWISSLLGDGEKKTLSLTSEFEFFDQSKIDSLSEPAKNTIKEISGRKDELPVAFNLQSMWDFNHLGKFGGLLTLFYESRDRDGYLQTEVQMHLLLALQQDVLEKSSFVRPFFATGSYYFTRSRYFTPFKDSSVFREGIPGFVQYLFRNATRPLCEMSY